MNRRWAEIAVLFATVCCSDQWDMRSTFDCVLKRGRNLAPRLVILLALVWSIGSACSVYPHQLAYFNEIAGGPDDGYRHLAHSNLDWGQDFLLVREWAHRQGIDPRTIEVKSIGVLEMIADEVVNEGTYVDGSEWTVYSPNRFENEADRDHVLGHECEVIRIGYSLWACHCRSDVGQ